MMNTDNQNCVISIASICKDYCEEKTLRPANIFSYKRSVDLFCRDTGMCMLQDITIKKLVKWRNIVASRSSETTYNNYHRHIRVILNYCVQRGLLAKNPLARISQFKNAPTRRKAITIEEFKTVCRHLESEERPVAEVFRTLLLVFYFTGMRRSQVCGLSWNDVDFDNDTIVLRKKFSKTRKEWEVPLDPRLKAELFELKKKR